MVGGGDWGFDDGKPASASGQPATARIAPLRAVPASRRDQPRQKFVRCGPLRRRAVIVAFLNHKGGVGKTTLALHVAGAGVAQGKRVVVVDTDSQGSALDWSEQRAKEGLTRLFDVLALARDTLHVEAPEIARDVDHVVIDGSSRITVLIRSAMLAADLALVPVQPSPFDGWAAAETLRLLHEARHFRPHLIARFVLNRCGARTLIEMGTRSEEHTSELQSPDHLVCRLLLEKKKKKN